MPADRTARDRVSAEPVPPEHAEDNDDGFGNEALCPLCGNWLPCDCKGDDDAD